ncbi:MAG: DUF2007 domain-containing protein [Ferruginibacter sp.]|nr:DUF2007 domain-containing protein [Cytophagales bacterium]
MTTWQKVFAAPQSYRAEMVRAILEEHGLSPLVVNKQDSNYHFGEHEVYVLPHDVLRALTIIRDEIQF